MGLSDVFRKAQDTSLSWQEGYSGREGYRRMYTELTESFYKEFPEMRGRVAVYNFSEPQDAQLAQIHSALNLKDGTIQKTESECATAYDSLDGKAKSVAWGVDPQSYGGLDNLKPKDIDFLAWHLTHEMFHTLDNTADIREENDPKHIGSRNYSKWKESLADAGRLSLYIKNMGDNPEVMTLLGGFVAGNDASAPAYTHGNKSERFRLKPLEEQVNFLLPSPYDNGEFLLQTLQQTKPERFTRNYALSGWRESFDRIVDARAKWSAVKEDNIQMLSSSSMILEEASERYQSAARKDLEPYRDEMVKKVGMGPEEFVENFFGGAKPYLYAKSADNPTLAKVSEVMLRHQGQFVDWARERQDYLPSAARMVAAHDFLSGKTSEVGKYQSPQLSDVECLERSYRSYQRTGDPLDKKAAEIFAVSYDGADLDEKAALLKKLEDEPVRPKAAPSLQSQQVEFSPAPLSPAVMR